MSERRGRAGGGSDRKAAGEPRRASAYAESWDGLARGDALDAICAGADPESFEASGREHAGQIRRVLEPGSSVLDFGCGIGRIAKYLAPHCRELHAVDVSAEMLARARKRLAGLDNVRLHQVDGPALPMLADGSVDFAYAMLVLHHLAKQDAFLVLREFGRVLRPGGRFFANFPNLLSARYTAVFEEYASRRERAAHRVRPWSPDEVRWLLGRLRAEPLHFAAGDEIEVLGRFGSS